MAPAADRRWLRWLGLPGRIALGFGAALLSLVAAALASHAALGALASAGRLVRHTAEARHAIEEVESALLVSQTSLEAYLTGREQRHSERFLVGASRVQPALDMLQQIAEQHPDEKPRIARLVADVAIVAAEQKRLLALVAEERGNVLGVDHHREGMDLPVTGTEIELTLATRDDEHCAELLARLDAEGYPVERLR